MVCGLALVFEIKPPRLPFGRLDRYVEDEIRRAMSGHNNALDVQIRNILRLWRLNGLTSAALETELPGIVTDAVVQPPL